MIDINTIISNALTAAVQQAIAPLVERIAVLEKNEEYLTNRIAALESDLARAVSVVEQRTERITALETKLTEAALFTQMTPATITADAFVTHLDNQEWFWEKLQNRIDSTVEAGIEDHCQNYDHDSYDAVVSDSDDYAKSDDIEDAVRDALSNMTFDVSIR